MKENDVYFHAEVYGAPHCFIQSQGKSIPITTMNEAAQFAVTFSKAWEQNILIADAYSVKPEQVSKQLGSRIFAYWGIYDLWERIGSKNPSFLCNRFLKRRTLMSGPVSAIKKNCKFFVELKQGRVEKNKAAVKLKKIFEKKGYVFPQEKYLSLIPNGGFEL